MLWLPHRRRGMGGGGGVDPEAAVVAAVLLLLTAAAMVVPAEGASWCIARSGASQTALQTALDYACGAAGADCTPIQPSGLCYLPNTLQAHASYAFNSYYQRSNMAPGSCDFAGTATVTITDPSSDQQAIQDVIANLSRHFSLKDLGSLHYFLGIEVQRGPHSLHLSQQQYIKDILCRAQMEDAKPISSPLSAACRLSLSDGEPLPDVATYRSIVGSLQYVTLTRPDISFAVNKVCQFLSAPTTTHWAAVKRILRYLKGTISLGLQLQASSHFALHVYSDADWAGDQDDRRSTSGLGVFFGSNLITWMAKKQATVARSSTEAELRAVALATTELIWTQRLLKELHVTMSTPPVIWCDNISALYLAANPAFKARTKHVEVDFHFVRQMVQNREVAVKYIASMDQVADIFTKSLPSPRFQLLRSKLHVLPVQLEGACER